MLIFNLLIHLSDFLYIALVFGMGSCEWLTGHLVLLFFTLELWRTCESKPAGPGPQIFFLQTRIAIPRYFSQSNGAYFKYIVHVHTRTVNVCAMLMIDLRVLKIRAI